MMKVFVFRTALLLSSLGLAASLFVPEELPTLLSFLYTNIPPVFKGTDSRVGIGFRVGPNADFQLQLELGPQTRTQPLGPDAEGSSKKRHVPVLGSGLAPKPLKSQKKWKVPDTPMGWLQTWKTSVAALPQQEEVVDLKNFNRQPLLDMDTVKHLQQLYKEQRNENEATR
ncbi:uncharacterized protein LOC124367284 [Homalodisca vitripennis]|uniref:uncharacterized protein LOC124367284 n=1 Tax=Homalodisca vitripennis TaxID=197043 RepID=UPI001EEBE939|nr:uncharacterized protein LOC124367284 [Homalodisca vitripennis]